MITIRKNEVLDAEMYTEFCSLSVAGADFGQEIRDDHPNITPANYKEYIHTFYETYHSDMDDMMRATQKDLDAKSPDYFKALRMHFGKDFSTTDYVGFVSIFNCNPRFVESGTFQIFYKKRPTHRIEVCFHEVMHFAFFDFCREHVSDISRFDVNTGPLWELSELVNILLLNRSEFRVLIGIEETLFYTTLATKLSVIREIWSKNGEKMSAAFVSESLKYIENTR